MKPKSPEQAAWAAECKRLLKKITKTSCDEKAKLLQEQYRLHVGLRPKPFLPGLREFGDTTTAAFLEGLASSGGTAIVMADEGVRIPVLMDTQFGDVVRQFGATTVPTTSSNCG